MDESRAGPSARRDVIDYGPAVTGGLKIVPQRDAYLALAADYASMVADQVMLGTAMGFEHLMQACLEIEGLVNQAALR